MNAWEISLKIISLMGDIDTLVDQKSKECRPDVDMLLSRQIDDKELEMFELKNKLKNINIL